MKNQEQYFEKLREQINGYRDELQKNSELLEFLSPTRVKNKLGPFQLLKELENIESIDLQNEYHLPKIVKTVQMLENSHHMCQRFKIKHKGKIRALSSRKGKKRSPRTHHSRNSGIEVVRTHRTEGRLMSPQNHQRLTQEVYTKQNVTMMKTFTRTKKKSKAANKQKESPIQKYIKKRAESQGQEKEQEKKEPEYTNEQVAPSFGQYNKDKHQNEDNQKQGQNKSKKQANKPPGLKKEKTGKKQKAIKKGITNQKLNTENAKVEEDSKVEKEDLKETKNKLNIKVDNAGVKSKPSFTSKPNFATKKSEKEEAKDPSDVGKAESQNSEKEIGGGLQEPPTVAKEDPLKSPPEQPQASKDDQDASQASNAYDFDFD